MFRVWVGLLPGIFIGFFVACAAYAAAPVHVWEDSIALPTYAEGDPDPVPQFAAFYTDDIANYPYPLRSHLSIQPEDRSIQKWRTLNLENEYLFCRILPDLGGHIYGCRDKLNNREIFFANPVIKKDLFGHRGAWEPTGIEPNFPVAHSRTTTSPARFAIRNEAGGAASVIVGDTDRVTGMEWRVEYRLRPGVAVLEEQVSLYNPTAARKPYLWWNNADIEWDDPGIRYIYPTKLVRSHGGVTIETWPVNKAGVDMSVVANDPAESAWFAYDCREPFMAIYKPRSKTGVAHYADPGGVTGKKMWIMGRDQMADYKRRLTDNGNLFVEIQAGLFTDQETWGFLEPEQSRTFAEYWIPFRDLGGVTRATPEAVLYAARSKDGAGKPAFAVELNATRAIPGARIRILNGGKVVSETSADLDPKATWTGSAEAASKQPFEVQLWNRKGRILLDQVEGVYDAGVPPGTKIGKQTLPDWNGPETESLLLTRETHNESISQPGFAQNDARAGASRFPRDPVFEKDAGRMALSLLRFDDALAHMQRASVRLPLDPEVLYTEGAAQARLGHDAEARVALSKVSIASEFGAGATFELALIAARGHDDARALKLLEPLSVDPGRAPRIAGLQLALLRRSGNKSAALPLFKRWSVLAPENSMVRYEGTLLGAADPALWSYLAGDGERVLDVADEYIRLGMFEDALAILQHNYATEDPKFLEPGAVPPQKNPLIAYYRAYLETILKRDPAADLRAAAGLGIEYVFPSRASSVAVLRAAVERNPSDASAHALLGDLDLYSFRIDDARVEWEKAVGLNARLEIERKLMVAALTLGRSNAAAAKELAKSAPPAAAPAREHAHAPSNTAPVSPSVSGRPAVEVAEGAMIASASGRASTIGAAFGKAPFTEEKQPDRVRQAYIEVQLQRLLQLSVSGTCDRIEDQIANLGNEDTSILFTLYGFGHFTAEAHYQYYLGAVEANCGRTKAAQKYWSKVAKMKPSAASPDFAYPLLAAARLDQAAAKPVIQQALRSLDAGGDAGKLDRGILLRASGDHQGAMVQLGDAARDSKDAMVQYLANIELGQPPLP